MFLGAQKWEYYHNLNGNSPPSLFKPDADMSNCRAAGLVKAVPFETEISMDSIKVHW